MNRAMIESLYLSSTTISQDELRALLDKVEEYGMTNMFNRVINASQEERDTYLQTTVRENIKRQEIRRIQAEQKIIARGKNEIDAHIKNEMLAHAIAVREASNNPITSEKNYEVACMLKAFAVEYMLKIINIMANTDDAGVKQFASSTANKQQLISDSMKDVRNKLQAASRIIDPTSTRRFTGHEINSLLNAIIPEQIRTLIKYKSITNYVDPATRDLGEFITPTASASSMNNFVADYFLLIKDFNQDNTSSTTTGMQDNAAAHNANYQSNNKAFETYRYRDKAAGLYDYNMLNCLMSSTYMILNFLLENRDLATNLQSNQVVPYEAVAARLTREEYDNLIRLCDNGAYDKNSLIYYHSFLKQYLDTRTPKLTDERYRRINTLFNEIKSAGDISRTGETFAEWFKNIKLETLTNEELKELKVIAPEFIYNSLSYQDKLIFKKCQEANIEFEYYYKMEPEKFESIINLYGPSLQGQSIDLKLLRKSPEELSQLVQTLGQYNLNLGTIPNYYYNYSTSVINYAHHLKQRVITDTPVQGIPVCVTAELEKARLELIVMDTIEREGINVNPSTEEGRQTVLRVADSIVVLETLRMQRDEATKSKFLDLDTQIKSGTINLDNCSIHGFNAKDYRKTTMMQNLEKKYRTDSIEPFINMSVHELTEKVYNIDWYVTPKDFKIDRIDSPKELSGGYNLNAGAGMILGNNPKVTEMMNKGVEVKANMLFLRAKDVSTSYAYVQQENPSLEMGDYLLYKTPDQVKEIIDTCHKRGVNFRPEFLYFDTDMVKNNIYLVDWALIGSSAVEDSEFTYETAQKISNQIQSTIAQRQQSQISYPQAITTASHSTETQTSTQPEQIIIISPNLINAMAERGKTR